jgi:hypothetical protein
VTTAGAQASTSAPVTLPSTSTGGANAPLMAVGGFLVAFGAFLLRRPRQTMR